MTETTNPNFFQKHLKLVVSLAATFVVVVAIVVYGFIIDSKHSFLYGENTTFFDKVKREFYWLTPHFEIPEHATWVGNLGFYECSMLKSVNIPEGVTTIGAGAFAKCENMELITIPRSVKKFGGGAFEKCGGKLVVNCDIPTDYPKDEVFRDSYFTEVVVGDGVKLVGSKAFFDAVKLQKVTISNSVKQIGSRAFQGCNSLKSITLGRGLELICPEAFAGCPGLTEVHIVDLAAWCEVELQNETANPLHQPRAQIYLNGAPVTDLVIPDGTRYIRENTFYNCDHLTSVTIPGSVVSIGKSVFEQCSNITSLKLNEGLERIGTSAFKACRSLTTVKIPNTVYSIGYEAFCDCSKLTDVTLSSSLRSMGSWAFAYCWDLPTITIPSGVKEIDREAFAHCHKLTSIYFKSPNPALIDHIFENHAQELKIYVPRNAMRDYRNHYYWRHYTDLLVGY